MYVFREMEERDYKRKFSHQLFVNTSVVPAMCSKNKCSEISNKNFHSCAVKWSILCAYSKLRHLYMVLVFSMLTLRQFESSSPSVHFVKGLWRKLKASVTLGTPVRIRQSGLSIYVS